MRTRGERLRRLVQRVRAVPAALGRAGRAGAAGLARAFMGMVERLRRMRHMLHVSFWRELSPPVLLLASFVLLIGIGTAGFLLLPGLYTGARLDALDAVFTATSAVCVTGLIVVDTATYFTIWGQLWILMLIQLGGLGLITLTTAIIGALGRKLSLRTEMVAVAIPHRGGREVWQLTLSVARFTFALEAIGAAVLFVLWWPRFGAGEALWHALFHSVSAFCNAGFSTFSDSLMGFATSPLVLVVVSLLIIGGGIGFLTLGELSRWWHARRSGGSRRLSSHTFAVVVTTAILLLVGTAAYALFEWNEALAELGPADKLANAWFMSVIPRTAGFSSISYSNLGNDAAFFTIMLMMVGGSPGSTAGGLKTTTVAVLVALALARFRGRGYVELNQRGLPRGTVDRAVSLALLAVLIVSAAFLYLDALESAGLAPGTARANFLPIAFETVSAFCTVGLSMDVTPTLAPASRLILIALMFIGRVGLLSFLAAISLHRAGTVRNLRPAEEAVIIG